MEMAVRKPFSKVNGNFKGRYVISVISVSRLQLELHLSRGSPGSSAGKESCNAGDPVRFLGWEEGFLEEVIGCPLQYTWASLVSQLVKNPPAVWATWIPSLGLEDPLEESMATHSKYSCLENPHGQRCLVGYSPWGCKELDTTE